MACRILVPQPEKHVVLTTGLPGKSYSCCFTTITTNLGFPDDSAGKESSCNVEDLGSISGEEPL